MEHKIDFDKLVCTTDACPTQWEGFTSYGHAVYIRYRGARFRVYVSKNVTETLWDAVPGGPPDAILLLCKTFVDRDPYSGHMGDEECMELLRSNNLLEIK